MALSTSNGGPVEPAVFGIPYEPPYVPPPPVPPSRDKKCRAKDDTCNGWRITDSDFCAYHAGKFKRGGP